MSRFGKACLITAGVLILAGLSVGLAGKAMDQEGEQARQVLAKTNWNLSAIAYRDYEFDWDEEDDRNEEDDREEGVSSGKRTDIAESQTFPAEGIRNLLLSVGGAKVEIVRYEDQALMYETDSKSYFKVYQSGDTLYIKSKEKAALRKGRNKFILYLPEDMEFKEAKCEIDAGEGTIESLTADELELSVGAGSVWIDSLTAREAELEIGAGELSINEGNLGKTKVDMGLGSAWIQGVVKGDLEVGCGMGRIEIGLWQEETDFNYEIEAAMGSVSIGGYSFGGLAGEKQVKNNAPYDIEVNCGMGSVQIEFEQ